MSESIRSLGFQHGQEHRESVEDSEHVLRLNRAGIERGLARAVVKTFESIESVGFVEDMIGDKRFLAANSLINENVAREEGEMGLGEMDLSLVQLGLILGRLEAQRPQSFDEAELHRKAIAAFNRRVTYPLLHTLVDKEDDRSMSEMSARLSLAHATLRPIIQVTGPENDDQQGLATVKTIQKKFERLSQEDSLSDEQREAQRVVIMGAIDANNAFFYAKVVLNNSFPKIERIKDDTMEKAQIF